MKKKILTRPKNTNNNLVTKIKAVYNAKNPSRQTSEQRKDQILQAINIAENKNSVTNITNIIYNFNMMKK